MSPKGLQRKDVDRLLAPEFVEGLAEAPVSELRAKRAECRQIEDLVSYLRRVVQGQIDLVVAEMEIRLGGGAGGHQHRLVEDSADHPRRFALRRYGYRQQQRRSGATVARAADDFLALHAGGVGGLCRGGRPRP